MTQDEVRRLLGSPAVAGATPGVFSDPLRVLIGGPTDARDVAWLYPAGEASQNAWLVLQFAGHGLVDIRCAHAWFEMPHDAAEP